MKILLNCGLACVLSIAAYSGVSVALVREPKNHGSDAAAYLDAYVFLHETRDAYRFAQAANDCRE